MRRKKGLIIDPSDICYEEESEEVGFESPAEIKCNLVQGFSFTNEPVNFAPLTAAVNIATPEKTKLEKQKTKKDTADILDNHTFYHLLYHVF